MTRPWPGRLPLVACLILPWLSACTSGPSAPVRDRLSQAEAMFAERCKKSGEFIHRTVEDVEGIFLLKLRPDTINFGHSQEQQFALDDPYGRDIGGQGYIQSFVSGRYLERLAGPAAPGSPPRLGYFYVEAIDPADGQRYRYSARLEEPWQTNKAYLKGYVRVVLDKTLAPTPSPRYGVTYDDISTRAEREHWIAGSSLKVIDLQTNEVIAERVGYMMDRAQGAIGGGRSPWLLAANTACPSFASNTLRPLPPGQGAAAQRYQTLDFVERVLIAKKWR